MNKEARIQVLQEVRALIESEKVSFLCHALERVRLANRERNDWRPEIHDLQRIIRGGLTRPSSTRSYTLGGWLLADLGYWGMPLDSIPRPYRSIASASRNASHLRLAWIDRMLEDLK